MNGRNDQSWEQVPPLVGREDYASWKSSMRAWLESNDLWGCINEEEAYVADQKKMESTKMRIIVAASKQNYSYVQDATTPKEAWQMLEWEFENVGLMCKVDLLRTLTSTKLYDCRSVEEYVNRITTAAQKLRELKFEVKDEMVSTLLLCGLPDKYRLMILDLESSTAPITVDAMKEKLLRDVKQEGTQNEEVALFFHSKASVEHYKGNRRSREIWVRNKGTPGGGEKKGEDKPFFDFYTLCPELAAIVGANRLTWYEIQKKVRAIVEERKLYDPENKEYIICDEDFMKISKIKRIKLYDLLESLNNTLKHQHKIRIK